jgi:hypothetical protein
MYVKPWKSCEFYADMIFLWSSAWKLAKLVINFCSSYVQIPNEFTYTGLKLLFIL